MRFEPHGLCTPFGSCVLRELRYARMVTTEGSKIVDGRTLRHQHRRPELLTALTDYALDNGINALSLRQAADAVGVTHATLIRHFESKDALVREVIAKIRRDLLARIDEYAGSHVNCSTADYLLALWEWLCEPLERRQFLLLFELVGRDGRDDQRRDLLPEPLFDEFLRPICELLAKDGQTPDDAEVTATAILAQIRGLQLDLVITGDRKRVDAAMTLVTSLILPHTAVS